MATPVVTNTWAGQFDCDACRRKRLMGAEFSNKELERYRKSGGPLKCKQCVTLAEAKERELATAKRLATATTATSTTISATLSATNDTTDTAAATESPLRVCASCQKELDLSAYNRNQWNKGDGKSKCRVCVEQAIQNEQQQQSQLKEAAITAAQEKVLQAQQQKSPKAILQAESELAALQAEQVTGLKPIKLSSSSSRGGRRGGGARTTRGGGGRQGRSTGQQR